MNLVSTVTIFTDGASRGNPGPGGWAAIIIFPTKNEGTFQITELGGREERTTNNRMELTGAIEALGFIRNSKFEIRNFTLYTDSSYVINGITKWIGGWKRNGWKTKEKKDVMNADLWQKLDTVSQSFAVDWQYVGGHVGVVGNERADFLATKFADKEQPNLFSGALSEYPLKTILDISHSDAKVASKSGNSARSKAKAYSYISEIRGDIKVHKTWAECEGRVKGTPGAKYRKALSPDEEAEIISAWRSGRRPEL